MLGLIPFKFLTPLLTAAVLIEIILGAALTAIFFTAFVAITSIPWALRFKEEGVSDIFEPYFGLSVLFFLYGFSTLRYVEENQYTSNFEIISDPLLLKYVIVCLLGQLGLVIGYLVAPRSTNQKRPLPYDSSYNFRLQMLIGPALLLSLTLFPFYFDRFDFLNPTAYSEASLDTRLLRFEDSAAGIKDVFLRDSPISILICASSVIVFNRKSHLMFRFILFALFCAYLITGLLSGWRGVVVLGALIPTIYYHYCVRRIETYPAIVLGIFVYILMNALSVMRGASDIGGMYSLLVNEIFDNGLSFLYVGNSGELATSSNLLRLISAIDNGETEYQLGGLGLAQFGAFIPRLIWPDRPLIGSELFVQTFYGDIYQAGGGLGFFFHQDGYWDFGFIGVILYSALLGWLVRLIYLKFLNHRDDPFWALLYGVVYGQLVLSVVRSGLIGSIKVTLMVTLPLLVILAITPSSRKYN